MDRVKAEKLGSLFLAIFSTGLAVQLATTHGMQPMQWIGAAAAVAGSLGMAVAVRVWPQPQPALARSDRRSDR
jgi:glycerol uptake facilitator-like aquaporin